MGRLCHDAKIVNAIKHSAQHILWRYRFARKGLLWEALDEEPGESPERCWRHGAYPQRPRPTCDGIDCIAHEAFISKNLAGPFDGDMSRIVELSMSSCSREERLA